MLTLLIVHGLAVQWRRVLAGQGFPLVWLAFVALAAGAAVLSWAITSLLTWRVLPAAPALFAFGFAAGLYPLLAALFTRAHRGLANPDQA